MTNHSTIAARAAYIEQIRAMGARRASMCWKAFAAGYAIATYSPGDGVTRYRFAPLDRGSFDYFGMTHATTVLGLGEAEKLAHQLFEDHRAAA